MLRAKEKIHAGRIQDENDMIEVNKNDDNTKTKFLYLTNRQAQSFAEDHKSIEIMM